MDCCLGSTCHCFPEHYDVVAVVVEAVTVVVAVVDAEVVEA